MTAPIALTCGDPAGIGPEIAVVARRVLGASVPFFWIGDPRHLPQGTEFATISHPLEAATVAAGALPVLAHGFAGGARAGTPDPALAQGVIDVIARAVSLVQAGDASAVCTGPISKKVLKDGAGFAYPGHTEFLAHLGGAFERFCQVVEQVAELIGRICVDRRPRGRTQIGVAEAVFDGIVGRGPKRPGDGAMHGMDFLCLCRVFVRWKRLPTGSGSAVRCVCLQYVGFLQAGVGRRAQFLPFFQQKGGAAKSLTAPVFAKADPTCCPWGSMTGKTRLTCCCRKRCGWRPSRLFRPCCYHRIRCAVQNRLRSCWSAIC